MSYQESKLMNLQDGQTLLAAIDNRKANKNGYYADMTVGNAEQLVATVGIEDKVPYNFRTSGGSADIGDREVDKLIGGTIAWNQFTKPLESGGSWAGTNGSTTYSDGVASITKTVTNPSYLALNSYVPVNGHVYFMKADLKGAGTFIGFRSANNASDGTVGRYDTIDDAFITVATVVKPTTAELFCIRNVDGAIGTTYYAKNVNLIDVTQMFGSTIANYIYTLETANAGDGVAYFRTLFPKPYYVYNAGELMSVKTTAHNMVGFNAWDEDWEVGNWALTDGTKGDLTDRIRSKNYIPVLPNTSYYFKVEDTNGMRILCYDFNKNYIGLISGDNWHRNQVIATPENCRFITFNTNPSYGTTYKNDICISLHWDGERDGEYEPYKLYSYPLDDVELRGIPKLDSNNKLYYDGDTYESDGTVTRKYGIVDLGTLYWARATGSTASLIRYYSTSMQSTVRKAVNNNTIANAFSTKYGVASANGGYTGSVSPCLTIDVSGTISVYDPSYDDSTAADFKDAMSGVYLVYELDTPTTESADPFQNPQYVDDWGTEEYVDERAVAIPVGHETNYRANLRAKLEMSPDSPDSNGDFVVRHNNGQNTYVPLTIPNELPPVPTTDGSYHLAVSVASGTPTFSWESDS